MATNKPTHCMKCGGLGSHLSHCPCNKPKHTPGQVRMAQDLAVSFGHHKDASLHLTALYAAAPDLLAALKDAIEEYPQGSSEGTAGLIRAAIAKAEGAR